MVKLYSDGKMSQILLALTEGESLLFGEPEGEIEWESVRAKKVCLIAAGSGEWMDGGWGGEVEWSGKEGVCVCALGLASVEISC